jgi:Ca2+-binding EF-hand superfamily protein
MTTEQEKRFAKVFAEFSDYISRDELKAIEKKFISFDTDGNGFIDLMELKV